MVSNRIAVIMAAQTYMAHGLGDHNFKRVSLTKDARRIENGWDTGANAAGMRAASADWSSQWSVRINKWVVQENQAVAISDLWVGSRWVYTSHCFKIKGDQIQELILNLWMPAAPRNAVGIAPALPTAKRPAGVPAVGVVQSFLNGLEKGDLSKAKLGADVVVTENGELKGFPREAARLHWETHWLGRVRGVRVVKWVAEGPDVVAIYEAEMTDGQVLWVTQYFRVYDGLIRETSANFGVGPTRAERATAKA